MTLMIPNAGSPMYIPRFNAITESPNPKTSDSVSAFSISVSDESIGAVASVTTSLNIGFSCSMSAMYDEIVDSSNAIIEISSCGCAKAAGAIEAIPAAIANSTKIELIALVFIISHIHVMM